MISMENIYLDIEAQDYREVLQRIGGLLQDKGYVKDSYTQALLTREELSPTGLPLTPWSIAIPHAEPEHVITPCIIVFQLKKLVLFKEMANPANQVPVKYVFGLVFTDGKKHLQLLADIIALSQDEQVMQALYQSTSKKEIFDELTSHLLKEEK